MKLFYADRMYTFSQVASSIKLNYICKVDVIVRINLCHTCNVHLFARTHLWKR